MRSEHRRTPPLWPTVVLLLAYAACSGGPTGTPPVDDDDDPGVEPYPAGNIAACGSGPFLTVSPVPLEDVEYLDPAGWVSPPQHTFPSTGNGFVIPFEAGVFDTTSVSSPGSIRIFEVTELSWVRRGSTGTIITQGTDYSVFFFPCADVRMTFGHIILDQSLLDQIGPFESGECTEHHPDSNTDTQACAKKVQIDLSAGAPIGTLAANLGFGAEDRRIGPRTWANPDRHFGSPNGWGSDNYACALDYFVPAVRNRFTDYFGYVGWEHGPRTKEPRCGSAM